MQLSTALQHQTHTEQYIQAGPMHIKHFIKASLTHTNMHTNFGPTTAPTTTTRRLLRARRQGGRQNARRRTARTRSLRELERLLRKRHSLRSWRSLRERHSLRSDDKAEDEKPAVHAPEVATARSPLLTAARLNTMVSVAHADKARSLVSLARGPAEAEKPQQQTKPTTKKPCRTHTKSTGSESFPDHAVPTSDSTLARANP